jgi:hypothetical protein
MITIKCVILNIMSKLNHNFDSLQNCMDMLKSEPGPCTGACPMSSDNGNQVFGIKEEEVTDIKVEEDPEPTASPRIKTEPAVSCLCVCVYRFVIHIAQISRIVYFGASIVTKFMNIFLV